MGFIRFRGQVAQVSQLEINPVHFPAQLLLLLLGIGTPRSLGAVHRLVTPALPGLCLILIALGKIKTRELFFIGHVNLSFMMLYGLINDSNHPVQLPAFIHQHPPLERKCLIAVILRIGDDLLDLHQGKTQLPEKQDLLQSLQIRGGVNAVSGFGHLLRLQESDLIIVVQRAHTDPRQLGNLFHLHPLVPPFTTYSKGSRNVRVNSFFRNKQSLCKMSVSLKVYPAK
ncbi:hypothetical protein D3C81_1515560 [compost metagenome]